jgi:hypothetical protein
MRHKAATFSAWVLVVCLVLAWLAPVLAAEEDSATLTIASREEFLAFAQQCSLDTYSENLTVELACDIDLTGTGFSSIAIFCGTFDGQGHTISGLNLTQDGSHVGLFRYVQTGAVVKNLHVTGSVHPGGSASMVGGIVGTNRGQIVDCSFAGDLSGDSALGGIAGVNEATGILTGCQSSASVTGYTYVGGIVGRNMGTVMGCENQGAVNTVYLEAETELSLPDLSVDRSDLGVVADVGGIAGLSTGLVTACVNLGDVGYSATGYNIGGIAGRQSGYVGNCENQGTVRGRKDVGGIVGQAEPHVSVDVDSALLPTLSEELNTLHDLVNATLADAKSASSAISAGFSAVGSYTSAAAQDAASLAQQVKAGVDTVTDSAAAWQDKAAYAVENAGLFLTDINSAAQNLAETVGALADSLGADSGQPTTDEAPEPTPETATPEDTISGDEAVSPEQTEEAPIEISQEDTETLPVLDGVLQAQAEAPDASSIQFQESPDSAILSDVLSDETQAALSALQASSQQLPAYTDTLAQDVAALRECLSQEDIDTSALAEQAATLEADLTAAVAGAAPVLSHITALETALAPLWDGLSPEHQALLEALQQQAEALSGAMQDGNSLLEALSALTNITLPQGTGESLDTLESMFQNLNSLGSCLSSLNTTVSAGAGSLVDDLTAVNDQFSTVMQLVVQALDDGSELDVTLFTDLSDQDDDLSPDCGKIVSCQNTGTVSGDLDVGGIVGTMGIEYDFDLEGDIFGSSGVNLSSTYLTRCVVRSCINQAEVTARKNSVGAVVGLMEQGAVTACQGYGTVTATDGDYVGGIAGQSLGTIRRCYALCRLIGGSYVGGIAGSGQTLLENRALVDITATGEGTGAIAGTLAEDSLLRENYFVFRDLGGVDNVSFGGQAEPMAYDSLLAEEDTPEAFRHLTITFQAQGQTVAVVPFVYGQSLDTSDIPTPPEQAGYTGAWESFETENLTFPATVQAVYTAYGATIAADAARPGDDSALPLWLAEGSFYPQAALTATDGMEAPYLSSGEDFAESWSLVITGAVEETDGFVLHYRLPESEKPLALYAKQTDGTWQKVDYTVDGQYGVFSIPGSTATICAVTQPSTGWMLWLGIALGAAVLGACAVLVVRRKKKNASGAHLKT